MSKAQGKFDFSVHHPFKDITEHDVWTGWDQKGWGRFLEIDFLQDFK